MGDIILLLEIVEYEYHYCLYGQRGDMIKNRYIKVSVYFCELEVLQ